VLANHRHRFLIAEQLEEIGKPAENIVLEPVSRNTGPSACIAALIASRQDEEALVLLAPSDHMIGDTGAFLDSIETGLAAADAGALVTFGIEPDCPHTGYGYIETQAGTDALLKIRRFVEKPSLEAAEPQSRRPLSGEMHHGEAGRQAVAAKPSAPLGALGGRHRDLGGHTRRGDRALEREPVHLHPDRQATPPRQSWEDPGVPD
jgi:hypothetical protein